MKGKTVFAIAIFSIAILTLAASSQEITSIKPERADAKDFPLIYFY